MSTLTPIARAERPLIGDHWHAIYEVIICGEKLPPFPEPRPLRGIHTHGDGIIHIEPATREEEGANATLGLFLRNVGVSFSRDLLRLPDGRQFRNGDDCLDGQRGTLKLEVGLVVDINNRINPCGNYQRNEEFERYRPTNADCIRIVFGP
jgi:hypothetical protein